MNQEKFLQTLKILKFPDVNKYSPADFDSYFSDPNLLPFLEYLGSLDENNVLTPDEIKEFASISPNELNQLENQLKVLRNISEEDEDEKKEEEEYLKDRLTFIEKRCKALKEQKEKLLEHQEILSVEKTKAQEINLQIRRLSDDYSLNKLPQILTQLISTVNSAFELISQIKNVIESTDKADNILPGLNIKNVDEYFEIEEKIIIQARSYLLKNLEFKDESMSTLNVPGITSENILKEVSYLRKSLHSSTMSEYITISDLKKRKISLKLARSFEAGNFASISESSSSQLSSKLEEERKCNEKLQKEESLLISQLSKEVSERINAQCQEALTAHSNEVLSHYKKCSEALLFPLKQLLNQRARLEFLTLYLTLFQKYLQSLKTLIDEVSSFVESEENSIDERKHMFEQFFNESKPSDDYLPQESVFLSAYKILRDVQHQDASKVTLSDVVTGIKKLSNNKEQLLLQKEERKDTIEAMEKKYSDMEKLTVNGNEFIEFMKLEKNLSEQINQLEILLTEIHRKSLESEKFWSSNNKLLETKKNLQLGRSLFLYALLEREKFEKIIDEINTAAEYEASSTIDS